MPETSRGIIPLPVRLRCSGRTLEGLYSLPENPAAWIIALECESGMGRPMQEILPAMTDAGYACLAIRLFNENEIRTGESSEFCRLNVDELAERIFSVMERFAHLPELMGLEAGLLVWGNGAGAALVAAARMPDSVKAAVVCQGRPDFAGRCLRQVNIPVMLMTLAQDDTLGRMNAVAASDLKHVRVNRLVGGSSLEDEIPDMLAEARHWFHRHLPSFHF